MTADWVALARCRTEGSFDMFFPTEAGTRMDVSAAKRICQECQVNRECLTEALRNGERYGIWGGLNMASPDVRRAARRRLRR